MLSRILKSYNTELKHEHPWSTAKISADTDPSKNCTTFLTFLLNVSSSCTNVRATLIPAIIPYAWWINTRSNEHLISLHDNYGIRIKRIMAGLIVHNIQENVRDWPNFLSKQKKVEVQDIFWWNIAFVSSASCYVNDNCLLSIGNILCGYFTSDWKQYYIILYTYMSTYTPICLQSMIDSSR